MSSRDMRRKGDEGGEKDDLGPPSFMVTLPKCERKKQKR